MMEVTFDGEKEKKADSERERIFMIELKKMLKREGKERKKYIKEESSKSERKRTRVEKDSNEKEQCKRETVM